MKEKTKRKIFGNRLYAIYRRVRYIRYLRRIRKQRRQLIQGDVNADQNDYKVNLNQQKKLNIKDSKQYRKQQRLELKLERKEIRRRIREQEILIRKQEKLSKQKEKEERELLQREIKKTLKSKQLEEIELSKRKKLQQKDILKQEQEEVKRRLKEKAIQDRRQQNELKQKQKYLKKQRKLKKRRLRPYLFRRRIRAVKSGIVSINGATIKRWSTRLVEIMADKEQRAGFIKITLNSTVYFVFSYICLFYFAQIITILVAHTFDYNLTLYYYKIFYNIESGQWSGDSVKILYSITPVFGLLLGVIFIIIYSSLRNESGNFKLFFLWGFVNGMVMFFGSLLIGTLLNQGFGWVIAYLYYKDTGKMVFSIISVFSLVSIGASVAKSFLISGNTYFNYIDRGNKKFLLISQVLIPAILGTIVLVLLKLPNEFYYTTIEEVTFEIVKLSTIILVIIPVILSFASYSDTYFDEDPRKIKFNWIIFVVVLSVIAGLILSLKEGLQLFTSGA